MFRRRAPGKPRVHPAIEVAFYVMMATSSFLALYLIVSWLVESWDDLLGGVLAIGLVWWWLSGPGWNHPYPPPPPPPIRPRS